MEIGRQADRQTHSLSTTRNMQMQMPMRHMKRILFLVLVLPFLVFLPKRKTQWGKGRGEGRFGFW